MATPRVFLSSTCYDLAEVRDSLCGFIQCTGFDPCLSDRGDVFYHPGLHTHDSCLTEVSNCHLFVLIIGGRFGGNYVASPEKSIVNAEYAAARELNIPVFTFIKRDVLDDHRLYQKNKKNNVISQIEFPSIDKREHAEKIFSFIDEVRLAKVNNGFFPFEYSRDIESLLKKQWAGMFFETLQQRRTRDNREGERNLLSELAATTEQLGQLVKGMYHRLDKDNAKNVIENAESRSEAEKFFRDLFDYFNVPGFFNSSAEVISKISVNKTWFDFLSETKEFMLEKNISISTSSEKQTLLMHPFTNRGLWVSGPEQSKLAIDSIKGFAAFGRLSQEQKKEVVERFMASPLSNKKWAKRGNSTYKGYEGNGLR